MNTDAPPAAAAAATKTQLTDATKALFWLASCSHTLRAQFGIEVTASPTIPGGKRMNFKNVPRPWLVDDHGRACFDPDVYAQTINDCSDGEHYMRLFILNVWSASYARSKGWHFDLFKACRVLDTGNLAAVAAIIQAPNWP